MSKITIYEKPTCTTCRKVAKAFSEQGIDFDKVNYYIKPFTKSKLKELLNKMSMNPSELLRKNDESYKKFKSKITQLTEDEILNLMIKNPDLVQRPIVENGNRAILARPPERIKEVM